MVALSDINNLKTTTLDMLEKVNYGVESRRTYLGMSQLGHPCSRFLWYQFRWAFQDKLSARIYRLFRRGHREEETVIQDLEAIGCKITGAQDEFTAVFGHVKGHCDGQVSGLIEAPIARHILEIKTMNDKYFKQTIKSGIKLSKPVYYAQGQLYMDRAKLDRCLFVCVNKNDDSYYIERVKYDKTVPPLLWSKATDIVLSPYPPTKVFKPTWYECKWCAALNICHNGGKMDVNCRTCVQASPTNTGTWECGLPDMGHLDKLQQINGCSQHVPL